MSITPYRAARMTATIIGAASTTRFASTPPRDRQKRPRAVRAGRCPDCRGSGLLRGPDATGAQERCCWCDGSGAAAA